MCYSAMVSQRLKTLSRTFNAQVDERAFEIVFDDRLFDQKLKLCRALEANFDAPQTPAEQRIHDAIAEYRLRRTRTLETEMFKQRKRLADAGRALQTKETKALRESVRIATARIQWHVERINDLRRTTPVADDSRIFPMYFAPVIVSVDGRNVIRPMRYHCRPAGKPAVHDTRYPGCYNARRDNLEGFWKRQFGRTHAIVVVTSFFENVARHDFEKRERAQGEKEQNVVLHFNPSPPVDMYVACLWSHWEMPGARALDSFAAITDEPPAEVRETGHDRCIVPIKQAHVEAWLNPQGRSNAELQAILDDRERPYYEHRMAA